MKTLILGLDLKVAGDLLTRTLARFRRSHPQLEDIRHTQLVIGKAASGSSPTVETFSTVVAAKTTIIVMDNPLDVQITVGAEVLNFTSVNLPIILPGTITSIQFTNNDVEYDSDVTIVEAS